MNISPKIDTDNLLEVGSELTLLSYNIHKGYTVGNRRFVLEGIKNAIIDTNADIVFLQEVVGKNEKKPKKFEYEWPQESQFEFLAHNAWDHGAYLKNAEYAHGHHGNALMSRYPLADVEHQNISNNIFERRGFIYANVGSTVKVHLVNIHLDLLEKGRIKQLNRICDFVLQRVPKSEPLIVAGDFNDWRRNACSLLEERLGVEEIYCMTNGKYAKTFPSFKPLLALDRIYARNLELTEAEVLSDPEWARLSDHCGLIAKVVVCK